MKRKLLILVVLLISVQVVAQDYQEYKFMHPKPQANNLRKARIITADTWVAAGANGTFMRTTNAGTTWYFHHKAGRHSNAAQMISQNYDLWFFNTSTGIVGGDRGYLGRTTDGGVTFDSTGLGVIPVTQRVNAIWFADNNTGFAAAGASSGSAGTIAKTTDGGLTWSASFTVASSFLAITGTSTTVFHAVAANGTVYKTTDAGATWNASASSVSQFNYSIAFADANNGLIAGGAGNISKTTDGGTSWITVTSPQTNWSFFDIEIVSLNEVYIAGDPQFLWKTTDFGSTWTSLAITPVTGPSSTFIWYSIDKLGQQIILAGDYGVVARSTDYGATWSAQHQSLSTQLIFDLDRVPGTGKLLAVGRQSATGTRQLYASTDQGMNWTSHDLGVNFHASSISIVNSQIGYLSGTNSRVMKTTDGGTTWTELPQPISTNYDLYTIDFVTADTGWIFVNFSNVSGGNIFKTTNGGQSWVQQTNGVSASIYHADMISSSVGYHCLNSSNRPIYKTTDGGATWTAITTPLTGNIRSLKVFDENNLIISASSGTNRLARSTNGGTTWTVIPLPFTVDITSIDFTSLAAGFIIGNSTTVAGRTLDSGATWTFHNLALTALTRVIALHPDTAFVFGTYASILKFIPDNPIPVELATMYTKTQGASVLLEWATATETNNSGFFLERLTNNEDTWKSLAFIEGNGTSTETRLYRFTDSDLKSGTYQYRLKQIDFDGSFRYHFFPSTVEIAVPESFVLSQNYPNPFNPSTKISYSIPIKSLVTLKVFDILGREVATLINELMESGSHTFEFDASLLASGVYYYTLTAGPFKETRKMVLLR